VERPVSKFCLPSTQNLRRYSAAGAYFVTLIIVGTYFIVSVFVAAGAHTKPLDKPQLKLFKGFCYHCQSE
jgi:hypothetical protein